MRGQVHLCDPPTAGFTGLSACEGGRGCIISNQGEPTGLNCSAAGQTVKTLM